MVLFAGRLAEQKRVDDLLKALDLLQHVQPDLRTVIAGDGPLRDRLEETAATYHLDGRVRFLGHRDDVPQLLAAADLVVLPSSYEGLPNVVLEAMRFRKPVVATAAPGTTEVVVDGETGLLVPIGKPTLLARAIRDVVRDSALARRLGEAGRGRVEAQFRADTMVAQFAQLYESLARSKGIDSTHGALVSGTERLDQRRVGEGQLPPAQQSEQVGRVARDRRRGSRRYSARSCAAGPCAGCPRA